MNLIVYVTFFLFRLCILFLFVVDSMDNRTLQLTWNNLLIFFLNTNWATFIRTVLNFKFKYETVIVCKLFFFVRNLLSLCWHKLIACWSKNRMQKERMKHCLLFSELKILNKIVFIVLFIFWIPKPCLLYNLIVSTQKNPL
jgi:hypothetical protein